jgi:hypothetical protein
MKTLNQQTRLYGRSESSMSGSSDSSLQRRKIFQDCWASAGDNPESYVVFVKNARGIRFRASVNIVEYVPDNLSTDDDSDEDFDADVPPKWLSSTDSPMKAKDVPIHEAIHNAITLLKSCFITKRTLTSKPPWP